MKCAQFLSRTFLYTKWFLFICFSFNNSNLFADHLNGGVISYEYLGKTNPGSDTINYKITLDLFGSCLTGNDALLEAVSLFIAVETIDTIYSYDRFRDSIEYLGKLPQPNHSCMILPSSLCIDQGRYEYFVSLPIIDDDYILVVQNCCLNQNVVNIPNPGQKKFFITSKITALAQQLENSSPILSQDPPYGICSNEYVELLLSFDEDANDDLIFSFCPVIGGFDNNFISLPYNFPMYTPLQPLGNPGIKIDPNTGLISGAPQYVGKYLVGVCISEYRNGQLLSESTIVFQLSVVECIDFLEPNFGDDAKQINDRYFEIILCEDELIVQIENLTDSSSVDSFYWRIEDEIGSAKIDQEWEPKIDLPFAGDYSAELVVNPNSQCADTVKIKIRKPEKLTAGFSFNYDTCKAGPIYFLNESIGSSGVCSWSFGDGQFSFSESNPEYQYSNPGWFNVELVSENSLGCKDTTVQSILWQPAPSIIIVEPSEASGCAPIEVGFRNLSFPIDSNYSLEWDFSPSLPSTISGLQPIISFTEAATYGVSLKVTSPIGCTAEAYFPDIIDVFNPPIADFNWTPETPSSIQAELYLFDNSIGAVDWYFNTSFGESLKPNPVFPMPSPGNHQVLLEVFDKNGCSDQIQKTVEIGTANTYFLPNAFSPNGDGVNDIFVGTGQLKNIQFFHLIVTDRWGQLVFETNSPNNGWNGSRNNFGYTLPSGVYSYKCLYQFKGSNMVKNSGFITLIK